MNILILKPLRFSILITLILLAENSRAQFPFAPVQFNDSRFPPIRHAVPFHAQKTMVWCWVAAAEMVAEYYARQPVPEQCAMLQMQYGAPCCIDPTPCLRPGAITEVQALVAHFGCRFSGVAPPANGFVLYDALKRGPIIMHTRQGAGHFVVATGMRVMATPYGPCGMVSIHDPLLGPYEIDFPTLLQNWDAAVVVY